MIYVCEIQLGDFCLSVCHTALQKVEVDVSAFLHWGVSSTRARGSKVTIPKIRVGPKHQNVSLPAK